jgi:hypothetical protein
MLLVSTVYLIQLWCGSSVFKAERCGGERRGARNESDRCLHAALVHRQGLPLPANALRTAKALAAFPVSPILIAVILAVVADDSLSQHQMKCTVPYIYVC